MNKINNINNNVDIINVSVYIKSIKEVNYDS
jgi:hypothetical protein